ncbi:hypothetical protein JCM8097_003291 [Rhodosporidiobolus ruineniae]
MPYLNSYTTPPPLAEVEHYAATAPEAYDLIFVFEVPNEPLETKGGVRVEPLIPSLHGPRLFALYQKHPAGFVYLPYGPFPTYTSFLTQLERTRRDEGTLLFVVYDLALDLENDDEDLVEAEKGGRLREERIAGIVGVLRSQEATRSSEVGHLHIPAPFQRTHILTHSITLLLRWLLDAPTPSSSSSSASPLGLRRVQWFSNALNAPSIAAAKRLGFGLEAEAMQWERILPPHKNEGGVALPEFLSEERKEKEMQRGWGRDSALLSMGWDRWECEGRALTDALVAREVKRRKASEVEGLLF